MERLKLAFCVHNHQPVGNFDWVFSEAAEKCYMPFLEVMSGHPSIRFSLHTSGPLIEWMDEGAPQYHDLVRRMVAGGQLELVGGGYYEPILPIWPKEHAVAQVRLMRHELERRYGAEARGMWLAERVWDPSLPQLLADAEVDYTVLDDSHFRYAGLTESPITGHYLTERAGETLTVFPISKEMRYLVPFKEPDEIMDFLKSVAEKHPGGTITYADDGEKFGIWPGTHDWVYKEGWLDRFLEALDRARDWLEVIPLCAALRSPPKGRIYLPCASYEEMMEWALPSEAILRYEAVLGKIKKEDLLEESNPFLRGGFWDNFLVKYPKSNLMHKRVLFAAAEVEKHLGPPTDIDKLGSAWRNIFRAQCNCAYWHGLFGGTYLNYLRHAIWKNLLEAEAAVMKEKISQVRVSTVDLNIDGKKEAIVCDGVSQWGFTKTGAACFLMESLNGAFAFHNTMARRPEAYHKLKQKPGGVTDHGADHVPASIHEIDAVVEEKPAYDRLPRFSFMDHFFPISTGIDNFIGSTWTEIGDFVENDWEEEYKVDGDLAVLTYRREGNVSNVPVSGTKEYRFHVNSGRVDARIRFDPKDPWPQGSYGLAFNFTLLAPDAPDRYYLFDGLRPSDARMISVDAIDGIEQFGAVDEYEGVALEWDLDKAMEIWRAPVMTLCRSESGFEKMYQGSWLMALLPLPSSTDPIDLRVALKIKSKGK